MKLNMLLNSPLGASAPFGLNMKCESFGGDVVGALIGGAFGLWANDDTNYNNLVVAERTNLSNQEINRQQLAWAREQYEQEKAENRFLVDQAYQRELENRKHNEEYNTPSAQMARLRAAGINPYLAMMGGAGSVGSSQGHAIGASVGQNPHANQPGMIPMQQGAPYQSLIPDGFGSSLVMALDNMAKNDIARDALNEQIEARTVNNELEYLKFLEEKSKNKTQKEFYDSQVQELQRRFALDKDKFEVEKDWQNFQKYYQQSQIELHQKEVEIQNYLAASKINVDNATIADLAASVVKMKQEVFEMQRRGDSEQEINNWLAKQEKTKFKNMQLDWKRRDPESYSKMGQQWNDFTNWLTSPIRGIISLGIKP